MKSYSQAGQDLFVLEQLGHKRNGTYLDIGCNVSREGNNTFLLATEFGWDGICMDLHDYDSLKDRPCGAFIAHDATQPYPQAAIDARNLLGPTIDYLSLDVDEATNAALPLALAYARYRVITIEHDVYARGEEQQRWQRNTLAEAGYELAVANVSVPGRPELIFEDWYIERSMTPTEKLLHLDQTKSLERFGDGTNSQFHHSDMDHFNQPTGISVEEGDFLYGLVRILRPLNCLETGTNIGVSASFICLALRDNGVGSLVTIEHSGTVAEVARDKLNKMGFTNFRVECGSAADYTPDAPLDFLWLDTELNQRFAELLRFFPLMAPGAVACIHDLPRMEVPEFGPVPDALRALLDSGQLAMLNFPTSHGVTVFQKR